MSQSGEKHLAYRVDPFNETISKVRVRKDNIEDMYHHMSGDGGRVSVFCLGASWRNGDTLYVDDEGLLKSGQRLFEVRSPTMGSQRLAGIGQDPKTSFEDFCKLITWTPWITR